MVLKIVEMLARLCVAFFVSAALTLSFVTIVAVGSALIGAPDAISKFPQWILAALSVFFAVPILISQTRLVFFNPDYPAPGDPRRKRRIVFLFLFWALIALGVASEAGWLDGFGNH